MAAKDKKERKTYDKAKEARLILIGQLNRCQSAQNLAKLWRDFKLTNKNEGYALFPVSQYHLGEINSLNVQIKDLFDSKAEAFGVTLASLTKTKASAKAAASEPVPLLVNDNVPADVVDDETTVLVELPVANDAVMAVDESEKKAAKKVRFNDNHQVKIYHDTALEDNEPSENPEKVRHLTAVRAQMAVMSEKAKYFADEYMQTDDKKYYIALVAVAFLLKNVESLTNQYARDSISLSDYKAKAKELFDEKNYGIKVINSHRGWKEVLANVLAAVIGSVVYFAAAAYAGTLFVLKPKTDTAKKAKSLADAVNAVAEDDDLNLNLDTICKC